MKKIKLISLVTVLAVPLSLCSCSLENFGYDYDSEYSEAVSGEQAESYDYENIDLDDFNEDVKQLLDDIKKSDNEKAVQNGIDNLLRQADIASDAMSYSCIESYLEWDNSDLEYDYDSLSETFYVICDALGYAFAKGSKSNEYSELFKELTDDESVEYFTQKGMNLSRVEGYASVDYSVSDDFLDDYYETAYDDSLSDDEKNLRCAEVYLEILSNINPEYYYENYNRDYTPDDILKLSKTVREKLQPVANELYDKFEDNKQSDNIFEKPVIFDNPFETIREYSARLSPDIENTANKIINDKLYTIASGDNCYNGSFTVDLPTNNSALVYIYTDDSYYDLLTAIHEFGHFYSSFYDETNAYSTESNIDIAEIQSQGMELMFMQFYDDIYGKQADAMKLMKAYDMADAVISSFLVGEFEYTALMQTEELTPEDVLELYDELLGDYAEEYPFYYMSHIFEAPGYYISYGVSALAAFDMFEDCINDPQAVLEKYEEIAAVPMNSKDCKFKASLKECGFSDVLTDEYIIELAEKLRNVS